MPQGRPAGPDHGRPHEQDPLDGFGPVLRGGESAAQAQDTPEGFGPVLRGRADPGDPAPAATPAPVRRGRGRRRGLRVLRGMAVVCVVLLLAVALTGGALLVTTSGAITRIPVQGLAASAPAMNVLLVGTDSREGLTREELQALGTDAVGGQRTDTILLLSISGGRAAMLSFPRDLWVPRCDGTRGRINTAHALGGPSCLVATVSDLTGIPVTHYAELSFVGFWRMVDAVGGVTLYLSEPMVDRYAGVDLPAGCVRLDGRRALGFVRARHIDNDLGRIARQQRFLRELVGEVAAPATLVNVPKLFATARAGASALRADEGLSTLDLLRLARGARGMAGGGIAAHTVPAVGRRVSGAAVLVPVEGEAAALFARFAGGEVLGGEAVLPQPSEITVAVRNGAGRAGLANQVAEALRAQGFRVSDVGNDGRVDRTVIRHAPEAEAAARRLAEAVPGAALEVRAPGTPLVLVLGSAPATVGAPASGAPAPADAPADGPATPAGQAPADC